MSQVANPTDRPGAGESPAGRHRPTKDSFVSILMPCLNEEATVATCVRKAAGWLSKSGFSGEVIVVDNGSTDRSAQLAADAGARVVHEGLRGYGSSLIRGLDEASGDVLVMGDCDDTYDFSDLDALVSPLLEGYDLVIGDRYAGEMEAGAMTWSHRYIGTPVITLLLRLLARVRVGDSQCGLRAFTRSAFERLGLRSPGMEFASEMILKASRRGLSIAEVPIAYGERAGESKLSTVRDGWRHLRFLLLASPHYLFTVPGTVLLLVGSATLALALTSSEGIEVGPVRWQPVFAGTILVVVGLNALLLGFASRLYTTAKGITEEDSLLRFYRKYLGLETLIGVGALLVVAGIATDAYLIVAGPDETDSPSWLDVSAIAQALIIGGSNLVLVGALASMLETE